MVEVSEFERALSELHRAGRCRWPPCAAALPSARGATSDAPLTRLLLGLSAFVPRVPHVARAARAARVARQAETRPAAVPAGLWEEQRRPELLREWSRLVQQRLEEGWRRAAACHGGGAVRRKPERGFVVLRGGGEQMHKAQRPRPSCTREMAA